MMRNNRDGTFRDVTAQTGLDKNNTRYSFCCGWNDFNRDGWPDLYVVNDFGRKNLYRNNGNGTFTDVAAEIGVEDIGAGMSVCWFDYDNDGAEDLYVANMWTAAGERITMQDNFKSNSPGDVRMLYHQHAMGNAVTPQSREARRFSRRCLSGSDDDCRSWHGPLGVVERQLGFRSRWVRRSLHREWNGDRAGSWRAEQFFLAAGGSEIAGRRPSPLTNTNRVGPRSTNSFAPIAPGAGTNGTFSTQTMAMALSLISRAFLASILSKTAARLLWPISITTAGRKFFSRIGTLLQLRILKNVMPSLPPSIAFRLRGTKSNRDAIGAVITIETDKGRQTRSLQAGSGFLSQHSKDVFFGLGSAKGVVNASIRWPSGLLQEFRDLPINHRIWVEEGVAPSRFEPFRSSTRVEQLGEVKPQPTEILPDTAETWLLAPISAPDFSLSDFSGRQQTLSSLRGGSVLLTLGAASDDRSRHNWSALSQWHASVSPHAHLIAINLDDPNNEDRLRAFVAEQKLSFPVLQGTDDVGAVYNILYSYLFDRHRDLSLPTAFLIDPEGEIVKVYQGPVDPAHLEHDLRNLPQTPAERLARALPFPGVTEVVEFSRNYLSYGSVYFSARIFRPSASGVSNRVSR
jgi:peroxiredoxin